VPEQAFLAVVTTRTERLVGARTLITGATGGLGGAIARCCAARRATIVVTGRQEAPLSALAAELDAEMVVADLTDRRGVDHLISSVGSIDVLISNAALPAGGAVETFSIDEIDRAVDVNLRAPIVLSRVFTASMAERGHGHVVFVSSLAASFPTPALTIYNATKSALTSYALSLRGELAPHGVGVSAVQLGPIRDSGMWADTGLTPPKGLGTRSPTQVGEAVVRAIEHNLAQVTVAPIGLRVGAVLGRAMPTVFVRLAPRLGAREVTDAMADALRHKR
jgi:short-subunit dehydrogenase